MSTVRYNFVVSKIDSDNIIDIMRHSITQCDEEIMVLMCVRNPATDDFTKAQIDWFKKHKEYLKELIAKMEHEIINDELMTKFDKIVEKYTVDIKDIYSSGQIHSDSSKSDVKAIFDSHIRTNSIIGALKQTHDDEVQILKDEIESLKQHIRRS